MPSRKMPPSLICSGRFIHDGALDLCRHGGEIVQAAMQLLEQRLRTGQGTSSASAAAAVPTARSNFQPARSAAPAPVCRSRPLPLPWLRRPLVRSRSRTSLSSSRSWPSSHRLLQQRRDHVLPLRCSCARSRSGCSTQWRSLRAPMGVQVRSSACSSVCWRAAAAVHQFQVRLAGRIDQHAIAGLPPRAAA